MIVMRDQDDLGLCSADFEPIDLDLDELDRVSGGRTVAASGASGTDPALLASMQSLVKAVGSINDNFKSAQNQNNQQIMQMMMQKVTG